MKIFVNARFLTQPVSGVQRYGIECSRQIKKIHHNTVFLAPPGIIHHDVAAELGAIVIGSANGHRWEQTELPLYMARQHGAPLLNLANTAPLFYRNNFVTIHDLAFFHHPEWNSRSFSAWYNFLVPRLARRSRHIFTVSNTIRNELMQAYSLPQAQITVCYNGISGAMLKNGPGKAKKEKIILAVGTFSKRKNHEKLVAAFLAGTLGVQYQLVIVGDKNRVFAESGIDEKTLQRGNIRVIAEMPEPELISMYQRAEIVVSLSLYEGFGIPVLEGLYHQCKVVCSDIPVYRELYDGYVHFCDPLDLPGINHALLDAAAASAILRPIPEAFNYDRSARSIVDTVIAYGK